MVSPARPVSVFGPSGSAPTSPSSPLRPRCDGRMQPVRARQRLDPRWRGHAAVPAAQIRWKGDPSKRKPYLRSDKQFLVTRNMPCLRRAESVDEEYDAAAAEVVLDDDEDGEGWLTTHGVQASESKEEEDIPSMDTLDIGKVEEIKSIPSYFGAAEKPDEEEDIPDMDTYEDIGDHSTGTPQPSYFVAEEPNDDNILLTRPYDVSITEAPLSYMCILI